VSTSYADSSTTGTTRSWGGSQTQAIEMTHTAGVEVSVQHEFGLLGGTTIGGSLSYEFSHSTRNETSTNWSQEQRAEHTSTLENAETREQGESLRFQGGGLATTVEVENEGNVAFQLNALTLTSYIHNPENPVALGALGNLTYGASSFPSVTLSPGGKRVGLNFAVALDEPTIKGLLRDSRNLGIAPATYTLTGPDGEDLQLKETNISARTAHVLIDYGLERPQEVYRVATIRDRDNPGLTVGELLRQVLRVPYTTGTFPWMYHAGTRASHTGLLSLRGVAASDAESSYWVVAHTHKAEGGASVETEYDNLLLEACDLESLVLQKGDVLHIVYVQDQDRDGLGDRSELMYGTDPNNPDTDGDLCADSLEVGGWTFLDNGVEKRVRPSPLVADTDGDGSAEEVVEVNQGVASLERSHTYATTGSYTVSVKAVDVQGLQSAASTVSVTISMPTDGLVSHVRFDGNVLDSAGTYDGGFYNFNRYGAARSTAAGQALDPRLSNETMGLFVGPHIPFSGSFTVAGWVNGRSVSGNERIWGQGDWFSLAFTNSSGGVGFSTTTGTSLDSARLVSASGHLADTWTFYAAVVAGNTAANSTTITLYRDGVQVGTRTVTGVFLNPGTCRFYVGPFNPGDNSCTGTRAPEFGVANPLNARVDDVRIYSRALSAAEVSILSSENR
jgi:Concanavalin A-like lectin/glucanases superfamily